MVDYSGKAAVIDDYGNILTFGQLHIFSEKFSKYIKKRSIIVIIACNTIESIAGYTACIRNRCIPLLLRNTIDESSLINYVKCYKANYIWVKKQTLEVNFRKLYVSNCECKIIYSYGNYALYMISDEKTTVNDELALLLTTSGSTGSSKMVRISYKNLESNTKNISQYLGITDKSKAITALPMNYTYGLSVINTHLYKRATIIATESMIYSGDFWKCFKKYDVTSLAGVPYTYQLLRKIGFKNMNFPALKTLMVAGGKISLEDERYYIDYAIENEKEFIVMYGQTEATARISYRPVKMMKRKVESIGIAIPKGTMWIEDSTGNRIDKSFVQGEIVYKGENVAMGYATSAEDLKNGYNWGDILHTGDIGYKDEEGYFYLSARKDRMVKINGVRIDLNNLEEILKERFKKYSFKCELEKCMETDFFTRIVVEVRQNQIGSQQISKMQIIQFLSDRTSFSDRYYHVIIGEKTMIST